MIFLSWSKTLSNKLALSFKNFCTKVFNDDKVAWISNEIIQGTEFFQEIKQAMIDSDISVIFLTRDNIANPWLHYELGFFQAAQKLIIPIFFDSIDLYNEVKMTPFEHLQIKLYNREDLFEVFVAIKKQLQNKVIELESIEENFNKYFDDFNSEIISILNTNEYYDIDSINDIKFMLTKKLRLLNQDNRVLFFEHGFETQDFYSFVLKVVKKRLYIFGRKNKKLFDRSNLESLKSISEKLKTNDFDLKILGISPNADESIINAAQKKRNFKIALLNSINDAIDILDECCIDYKTVMRFYNFYRNELIVIMDNCVFFMNIAYDNDGKPFHITDSPFYACDINSAMGKKMLDVFNKGYEKSEVLNFDN